MENLQLRDSGRLPRSLSQNRCNPAGGCVPNVPQNLHECLQTCPPSLSHSPRLILGSLLKYSNINLELLLLTDIDMHMFIEKGMRGGISMVSKRHAKANNPHTADYDPEKDNNYIMHYDANNLYGWAMSQPLPYSGFKWKEPKDGKFHFEKGKGYMLKLITNIPSIFTNPTMTIRLPQKNLL